MKEDRIRRAEEAGAEVETLLGSNPPLHQESWHRLKGWYRAAVNRSPPPDWVTLKQITAERVDLYSYIPPSGANITISLDPFPLDDSVPTEGKIEWVVKRIQNHCSMWPSGVRGDHLKEWLSAARKKEKEEVAAEQENPKEVRTMPGPYRKGREGTEKRRDKTPAEASNWDRVVDIIHTTFREG